MKTLTELIQNYQNGIPDSDSEILKRMEPLVKGYASRIHCMEREDSTQELYLTLLKTLPYLSSSSSEGELLLISQFVTNQICSHVTDLPSFVSLAFLYNPADFLPDYLFHLQCYV